MLDYKKLKTDFTQKLLEFDKRDLLRWIRLDESRQLDKLLCGETVLLFYLTKKVTKITDNRENRTVDESSDFATAA